ncbi:hypothetical protein [Paenibacillus alvei]|uniref:hypothetical protein n=1 Tax=Paenibacillus alvei TaxID=44250 RepID=UPI00139F2C54|nr:hypothetical protein [Paenibacillus alvei]
MPAKSYTGRPLYAGAPGAGSGMICVLLTVPSGTVNGTDTHELPGVNLYRDKLPEEVRAGATNPMVRVLAELAVQPTY